MAYAWQPPWRRELLFCIPFGFWGGRGSDPLLPGAYPADAFGALLRRLCRRSARRAGFDAAGAEGQRPTLVYDSCFESGGYEKTPAGNRRVSVKQLILRMA